MALVLRWASRPQGRKHGAVHVAEREQDGEPHRPEKELEAAGVKKLGDGHAKEVAARSRSQRQARRARGVERGAWAASSRGDRRLTA
jgi:hypothetical protein